MLITSFNNEHIKYLMKLKERKYRNRENKFLIEGEHLVLEAYKAGLLEELILEKDVLFPIDVATTYVTYDIITKLSDTITPSSIMGVVKKKKELSVGNKIIILDDIQDPGNLGTIIRSALAFNFDTVVLSPNTVDLYNSKVIRSTQGMIFHINVIVCELSDLLLRLKEDGYKIIGTKVTSGGDVKMSKTYSHFALIIGNESRGMDENLEKFCDENLYIRMNDACESLNAAVAASILMYELGDR